ncbi:MAG TPA: hypothetical protein VFR09_06245 [Alphaproteobacteria bacterium]|nr:hypothetical protein [Alphaproteobacteria bacterium]
MSDTQQKTTELEKAAAKENGTHAVSIAREEPTGLLGNLTIRTYKGPTEKPTGVG